MNVFQSMLARAGGLGLVALAALAAAVSAPASARADTSPSCPSSTADAYAMTATALTGQHATDVSLAFAAAAGCDDVANVKHIQVKAFTANGRIAFVKNVRNRPVVDGVATVALDRVERGLRIEADAEVQGENLARTHVIRDATTAKLRPDVVVRSIGPVSTLVGKPLAVEAVVEELNGDVGASLHATLMGDLGPLGEAAVTVAAGKTATVTFPALTPAAASALDVRVELERAVPAEYDTTNGTLAGVVEVTKNELPTPTRVLFPSLVGFGAQFNNHLYAPITPWPANLGYGDVENKVKMLEPQLVRIFYNDNWDANANGQFPDWQTNYDSFVKVVQLAKESGAIVMIGFQTLVNVSTGPAGPPMEKFADVLQDLVVNHGLTNVRWAEIGNEPNSATVSFTQVTALYQALNDALVARGLRDQVHLMAPGLVENGGNASRDHYAWMKLIASDLGGLVDAYNEHVYWLYSDPGRLEYRLRDTYHLMQDETVMPSAQRKPMYMMEFGIRGDRTCGTKPAFTNLYYGRDPSCPEIWRTNIAGFQQLWFNLAAAQLGVAGTSKWDAFWGRYDKSSAGNQLYWMVGPPEEGSPLTPSYYAMSLLFHTVVPGWQVIGVDPFDETDYTVPNPHASLGDTTNDAPEQELAAFAGPSGELTIVGLDTNGKDLNGVATDPPSIYSIGHLPPNSPFTLAVWNATGDGTNSIAGTVTTNAAGVARFEVPLQAAFALTNVPVG